MTGRLLALVAAVLGAAAGMACAADHTNLEEGLPVEIEDAFPIPYGGIELQGLGQYEREDDGSDRYTLEPRLELGVLPNLEATILAPFHLGSADKTGSRNLAVEALYGINQESLVLPAFAVAARGDLPTGRNSAGIDTTLTGIATKTVGATSAMHRLHLNAAWTHEAGRGPHDREHRYRIVAGYSTRLGPDTVLVADVVREQLRRRGENANLLELGLRRQVTPLTVVSIGAGAGIGEESPDVRVTIGLQRTLSWPYLGP